MDAAPIIKEADITGSEPAVRRHDLCCGFRIFVITKHNAFTAGQYFADRTGLVTVSIDGDLDTCCRIADAAKNIDMIITG